MADTYHGNDAPLTRREAIARESRNADAPPPPPADDEAAVPADGAPESATPADPVPTPPAGAEPGAPESATPADPEPAPLATPAARTTSHTGGRAEDHRVKPAEATEDNLEADDEAAPAVVGDTHEWTLHDLADELGEEELGATTERHRRPRDVVAMILGGVGELLVTAGVFLGLFVVWQIWWTDVKASQHTAQVIEELAIPEAPDTTIQDVDKQTGPAPLPVIGDGPYAVMRVPAWGAEYQVPITEGVSLDEVLHQGLAGHYPETQPLGQVGNFALAGHRQSHGAIFLEVDQLEAGDAIVVETAETWYVYTVTSSEIVLPTDVEVIAPVPWQPEAEATSASITLTTCHPLWSTAERFIVYGELEYWAPRDSGTPAELEVA